MSETLTIAGSAAASGSVDLRVQDLVGLELPAAKTGTVFSIHVSSDDSTFLPLYDWSSAAVSVTGVASTATAHALDPVYAAGWGYAKVVATSAQSSAIAIEAVTRMF